MKAWKSKMLLQVHDELVFDVPKEDRTSKNMVKNEMENAFDIDVPLLSISELETIG